MIKRAARTGDRFTSHVALPGGKQDPEDADDRATAIRETGEEVGIDLTRPGVIYVGNLAQRIVTAEWGNKPLMVLCPFVFLLTCNDTHSLRLQPTEIHSAHWVPLRALTAPSLRTYEHAELSDRLTTKGSMAVKWLCRLTVGQMLFGATRLVPSESTYCSSSPTFLSEPSRWQTKGIAYFMIPIMSLKAQTDTQRPMLLWGLTYGIVVDFLDLLPHFDVADSWKWPTFSAPDIKLITWLLTRKYRREKTRILRPSSQPNTTIIVDEGLGALEQNQSAVQRAISAERRLSRASAVGDLLFGYFALVKRSVHLTIFMRLVFLVTTGIWIARRRRQQGGL